jgi:Tfp pilus assembly protein PilX
MDTRPRPLTQQHGTVLVFALIFMSILTLVGLSISNMTTTEEKMARNFRDQDIAFAAAEATVRDAELRITGYYANPATPVDPYGFNSGCSNGLCSPEATQPVDGYDFFGSSTPGSNASTLGTSTNSPTISNLYSQPRYMIERICRQTPGVSATGSTCQMVYRITVQSRGNQQNTRTTLQEMYTE